MAGFRKAECVQSALKIGMYGSAGSGKTYTSLLFAEGLAKLSGKKIAFVDTETGTTFYRRKVPARSHHPEAFEFDVMDTKSLMDTLEAVRQLDPKEYCCVIVDSITHLWEAARAAYGGSDAQIPVHAWGKIKRPYKNLINLLMSSPMHTIICGRQGLDYKTNDKGDLEVVGPKMKAEGETPHEPHILFRMELVTKKNAEPEITLITLKDRMGMLTGKTFKWPTFKTVIEPLLPLLGDKQAEIPTEDDAAIRDIEVMADQEQKKNVDSEKAFKTWRAQVDLCANKAELKKVMAKITVEVKKTMTKSDVSDLRDVCLMAQSRLPE